MTRADLLREVLSDVKVVSFAACWGAIAVVAICLGDELGQQHGARLRAWLDGDDGLPNDGDESLPCWFWNHAGSGDAA